MTTLTLSVFHPCPAARGRTRRRWDDVSAVTALLVVGAALLGAAVAAWAVLDGTGLITPAAFTTLGTTACAGTALLHAAAALAAMREMRRP